MLKRCQFFEKAPLNSVKLFAYEGRKKIEIDRNSKHLEKLEIANLCKCRNKFTHIKGTRQIDMHCMRDLNI